MNPAGCDTEARGLTGRCLLGLGVLALTVAFSNVPELVRHPEAVFDVPRAGAQVLRLQVLGYALQMAIGIWLSVSLILDIARWRRAAAILWPFALVLYFAPLPTARDDIALAPALFVGALLLGALGWELDRATRRAA